MTDLLSEDLKALVSPTMIARTPRNSWSELLTSGWSPPAEGSDFPFPSWELTGDVSNPAQNHGCRPVILNH